METTECTDVLERAQERSGIGSVIQTCDMLRMNRTGNHAAWLTDKVLVLL